MIPSYDNLLEPRIHTDKYQKQNTNGNNYTNLRTSHITICEDPWQIFVPKHNLNSEEILGRIKLPESGLNSGHIILLLFIIFHSLNLDESF